MKKTKKALASLAIAGMVLTMVPFNAFATGTVPNRLAGTTAAQTAVNIAEQTGWTGTAILASSASYGMVDALTSGPLAKFLNAPILLQEPGATLNADTKAELVKLAVKKVYVTSGTAVISQSVLDQLSGMGITVVTLGGADRFETSVNIAKEMVKQGATISKVAVAYGWLNQDALSIAAIASSATQPILLTEKNALPASVKAFLTANITSADVIGGTGVISDAVKAALPNATRHAGNTAYDTNNQVIQDFAATLTFENIFAASGVTGIDALAGAPLAAQTKSAIVLTDGVTVPSAAVFTHSKSSDKTVVTALGGEAVVPETIRAGIAAGTVVPVDGVLSVTSVSAISVSGIKVVFNHSPADSSKVAFTVLRGTSPTVVSATWNATKTEATLAASGNYAEGDYIVSVKDGNTDLGTKTISITSQRVGKISVDSNVLAVTDSGKSGYVGYHVYDQYGTDITTSYLAGSSYIQWNCGVGNAVSNNKGLLTVTPFNTTTILTQYQTAVVTAVTQNQTIPASTNVTLNISTAQGTISDIALNKLTGPENAIPTVGDSEKYYIDYTAKDMAGNATTNLTLIEKGLITNHSDSNSDYPLISSNSTLVTAKVVEDPSDDQKASIEVTINDPADYNLMQDQPITITASTYTGKTSSVTFTLRRKQAVDTFTIQAPSTNIGSGETAVEIPYAANDQAGKVLTKYSDIKDLVTFSPVGSADGAVGLYLEENADATASLKYNAPVLPVGVTTAQQQNLSATVKNTGKFSNITLNVDLAKKADSLKLDDSIVIPRMEVGAVQSLDFGFNDGGFQVLDQYGRVIDMTSKFVVNGLHYFVKATSSDPTIVTFDGGSNVSYAGYEVKMAGVKPGSATVKFELMQYPEGGSMATATTTTLTKSISMTVLDDKDITGYVLDPMPKALYANANVVGTPTAQQVDFNSAAQEPYVYGTTTSGSKVVLKTDNIGARTSSSVDFGTIADENQTKLYAKKLADTKTGSTTTLNINIMNHNDNRVQTAKTTATSITDEPVAQSVGYYAQAIDRNDEKNATGITSEGNTVTVDLNGVQTQYPTSGTNFAAIGGSNSASVINALAGRDLTRFTQGTGASNNRGYVYLWAKDQYGSKAMDLSSVLIPECTVNAAGQSLAYISSGNVLTFNRMPVAGEYIVVSGTSTNGLVSTAKIVFKNGNGGGVVVDPAAAALTTAATAVAAYEALPLVTAGDITAAQASPLRAAATTAIAAATTAGATAAQTAPLTARVAAQLTKITNAVPSGTVNPYTVAPAFHLVQIDGTLDLTKAVSVKATGVAGTVTGTVNATTGAFVIDTATFSTELVTIQAYNAAGVAVGVAKSVLVM